MRRRDFIMAVSGAAAAWPRALRAQQPDRIRHVAFLHAFLESDPEVQTRVAAFAQGLAALGWSSRNLRIEHRFTGGDVSRIQAYVSDTVRAKPDLIVASSTPIVAALKHAPRPFPSSLPTSTIRSDRASSPTWRDPAATSPASRSSTSR
jgi:putative tryptophan/tyrosine transport system substrate-binding protein